MNTYGGPCCKCGGPNEPYMVNFGLWKAVAGKDRLDFICLRCFTKRLGRPLRLKDFIDAPINVGCFGFDCRKFIKAKQRWVYCRKALGN